MDKITTEKLIEFGFIQLIIQNHELYIKDSYLLMLTMGKWLIIGNHSGELITCLTYLETLTELNKHYFESTKNKLSN
jgi:hypothetical protein